jgi:hypothetical protein
MPNPIANAGSNQRFTFASLPTSAALAGAGTPFAPATAISSYLWELVEKPTGSSAALSSTTAQNPTLNTVDTPGTYLLFLRVTDDTAQQSEGDKLKADASAFVSIRAELANGLVKPAPSERDHADMLDEWAVDIDANQTTADTHIADTTDPHNTLSVAGTVTVTDAPAGSGEVLVSTSTTAAAWSTSSQPDAATGTKGITYLAEAAAAPASPKAVTRDRSRLTFQINDSYTASGWEPGHVTVQTTTGNHNRCHAVAYIDEDTRIKTYDVAFLDGGLISGGGYTVDLVRMTAAQFLADTVTDVIGTTSTGAPASDNAPLSDPGNAVAVDFSGGNYIGIYVTAGSGGSGLCVTVHMEKRW